MSCTVMYQPYAMSSYSSSCDNRSSSDKQKLYKYAAPSPTDSLHSDTSSYHSPGRLSVGTTSSGSSNLSHSSSTPRRPITPTATITSSRASSSSTAPAAAGSASSANASITSNVADGRRTQYLSSNCVLHMEHEEDVARAVDEHFSRSLSAAYTNEKSSKSKPMSRRDLPLSFWNSNYQAPKSTASSYTTSDYYGASVADYPTPIPGLSHHHYQTDPWHAYPLTTHQSYHHRPTEIPYSSMPSSSRFNAAQYGSLLLAGAAAGSGAGRFGSMATGSQCGVVKGDAASSWATGRYHHHDTLSDLHLDYTAAAAAAQYSNTSPMSYMTAGLETTFQDSSKDWF